MIIYHIDFKKKIKVLIVMMIIDNNWVADRCVHRPTLSTSKEQLILFAKWDGKSELSLKAVLQVHLI